MMRIKKRAYLTTFAILMALGGVAYYANWQSKKFELKLNEQDHSVLKKEVVPPPTPIPAQAPSPVPAVIPPPVTQTPEAPPEKSKTYIIELNQYTTKTDRISVPAGYKANLVIKNTEYRSGESLTLQAAEEIPILIQPGEIKTLSFKPETPFDIDVYLGASTVKAPYKIFVDVE